MDKIKELRLKMEQLATQARAKLEEVKTDTPEARAAEIETEFDTMMDAHAKIERSVVREERLAKIELAGQREVDPVEGGETGEARGVDEGKPVTYRDAFNAMLRAGGDRSELSSEYRDALRSGVSEFRTQTAGTNSAGGYTVPTELADFMVKSMLAWGPMYDGNVVTDLVTSGGGAFPIPTADDTSVTAGPHTEGSPLTDDGGKDVTLGQKTLGAYVFDTEFVKFSMELVQDSAFSFENLLGDLLGERLARIANAQLTTGTGSGAPNGIVTASTLGKTAAGVAAITSDEILDLLHSVDPAYRKSPKAGFMLNDNTVKAIRKLKDGNGNYLWQMGDVSKGIPGSLLGYNFYVNQSMADIATGNKTILFGDLGKYFVRKVGAPVIGVMRERFWPDLGIAGLIRFDGELSDTAAVKHLIQA